MPVSKQPTHLLMTFVVLTALVGPTFVAGCSRTQTSVKAFRDPGFAGRSLKRPAVLCQSKDLQRRQLLEDCMVEELSGQGVLAEATIRVLPPTREYTQEEWLARLAENNIDALVLIDVGEIGVKDLSGPTQTYSQTAARGLTGLKPWEQVNTKVVEVSTGNTAWVASSFSSGNAFASFEHVQKSYCRKVVKEMLGSQIFVTNAK